MAPARACAPPRCARGACAACADERERAPDDEVHAAAARDSDRLIHSAGGGGAAGRGASLKRRAARRSAFRSAEGDGKSGER
eukprot:1017912-Prymnesium_polylepis.1